jgi:hypothetical protein
MMLPIEASDQFKTPSRPRDEITGLAAQTAGVVTNQTESTIMDFILYEP